MFYKQVFETILCSIVLIIVGYLLTFKIVINSWITFILSAMIIGVVGLVINVFIILNKEERKYLINKVKNKIGVKSK